MLWDIMSEQHREGSARVFGGRSGNSSSRVDEGHKDQGASMGVINEGPRQCPHPDFIPLLGTPCPPRLQPRGLSR